MALVEVTLLINIFFTFAASKNGNMYKITKCFIGVLVIMTLFFSCNRNNKEAKRIFTQVENLIGYNPDSALMLLKSIKFPEDLNSRNYADYLLLYIESKDKSGMSIAEDTLIWIPVSCFLQRNDILKTALSYFYSGRVNYQQGKNDKAIQDLLLAGDYAEKSKNDNLLGLIHYDLGLLYSEEFNFELALNNYLQSHDYFLKAGNEKNAIYVQSFIGDVYLLQEPQQIELAFENYYRVLRYAEIHNDTSRLVSTLRIIGITYEEMSNYLRAKEFLLQSISIDKHKKYLTTNYTVLSKIYLSLNMPDSAVYYAEQLSPNIMEDEDYASIYNYYDLMGKIYTCMSKHEQASKCYRKQNEFLALFYDQIIKQSVLEIQKKYESEKLKNSLQKTELHRRFLFIIVLLCIIAIIILAFFSAIVIKRKKEEIRRIEQNLETMRAMLHDNNDENKHSLRQVLMEQLDIVRKIAQLETTPSNAVKQNLKEAYFKIFGKNLTEQLNWDNLYPVIDNLYNGFVSKLRNKYPDLLEKQIQLCCLLRADFKTEEITFILNYDNVTSTQTQKTKLRMKMGFSGIQELLIFLKNI